MVLMAGNARHRQGGKMENWLTIEELAEKLRVKKSWIYRRTMESGPAAIPRIKVGKFLRFDPGAVEQWLLKRSRV